VSLLKLTGYALKIFEILIIFFIGLFIDAYKHKTVLYCSKEEGME